MEEYKLYNVERDGKSLKLKRRQLNIAVLSKLFHLFPESIVLVSDDGYVETPDEDGNFIGVDDLPTWIVLGDSTKPTTQPVTIQPITTPYVYQPIVKGKGRTSRWTPTFTASLFKRQKPPGVRAQESQQGTLDTGKNEPEWRKYIEICKWSGNAWKRLSNLPIQLTDSDATVERVSQIVADDAFNGERVTLLDNEYLKILDTVSTRGESDVCAFHFPDLMFSTSSGLAAP